MNFVEQIVNNIIRPPRDLYRIGKLGPPQFLVPSVSSPYFKSKVRRQDTQLHSTNNNNQTLHLSLFTHDNQQLQLPCVIYLHANNGSRCEGLQYLMGLIQNGFNVAIFDCCGSGVSQGEFVTLGIKETEDLDCVVNYLVYRKGITGPIVLWGRSMGAVTAILYSASKNSVNKITNQPHVVCCIYDSPFYSLKKLIKQLFSLRSGLPQLFLKPFFPSIESKLQEKANFSLQDLKLKKIVGNVKTPGLFITSHIDKLVACSHAERLFREYGGSVKQLEYTQVEHHEPRPRQTIDSSIEFIKRVLRQKLWFKQHENLHLGVSNQNQLRVPSINLLSPNYANNPIGRGQERPIRKNTIFRVDSAQQKNRKTNIQNVSSRTLNQSTIIIGQQQQQRDKIDNVMRYSHHFNSNYLFEDTSKLRYSNNNLTRNQYQDYYHHPASIISSVNSPTLPPRYSQYIHNMTDLSKQQIVRGRESEPHIDAGGFKTAAELSRVSSMNPQQQEKISLSSLKEMARRTWGGPGRDTAHSPVSLGGIRRLGSPFINNRNQLL